MAFGAKLRIIYIMKNKAVKIGIAASLLPHVFCCGLPIALSIVGLIAPETAHLHSAMAGTVAVRVFRRDVGSVVGVGGA